LEQPAAFIFRAGKNYLEDGGVVSSTTLITVYQCTWNHIPEDSNLHKHMSLLLNCRKID
jgi:hypothetical protein